MKDELPVVAVLSRLTRREKDRVLRYIEKNGGVYRGEAWCDVKTGRL